MLSVDEIKQATPGNVPRPEVGAAISARDLVKIYPSAAGARRVLDGVSFSIAKGEKIAILGRNGAGKSTLVRILAGIEQPTSGRIERNMSMSWPLGLAGGFSGTMTGYDCGRFVSRVYGKNWDAICDFLEDFSELGPYLAMPIKTYSSGMRARLAFGISLAVDFDCYLIDEIIAVGDRRFQKKSFDELFGKRKDNAMIIVSHNFEIIQDFCSSVLVLKDGRGRVFQDKRKAFDIYATL